MIFTALFYKILFLLLYLIFARKSTEYCSEKRKNPQFNGKKCGLN